MFNYLSAKTKLKKTKTKCYKLNPDGDGFFVMVSQFAFYYFFTLSCLKASHGVHNQGTHERTNRCQKSSQQKMDFKLLQMVLAAALLGTHWALGGQRKVKHNLVRHGTVVLPCGDCNCTKSQAQLERANNHSRTVLCFGFQICSGRQHTHTHTDKHTSFWLSASPNHYKRKSKIEVL